MYNISEKPIDNTIKEIRGTRSETPCLVHRPPLSQLTQRSDSSRFAAPSSPGSPVTSSSLSGPRDCSSGPSRDTSSSSRRLGSTPSDLLNRRPTTRSRLFSYFTASEPGLAAGCRTGSLCAKSPTCMRLTFLEWAEAFVMTSASPRQMPSCRTTPNVSTSGSRSFRLLGPSQLLVTPLGAISQLTMLPSGQTE